MKLTKYYISLLFISALMCGGCSNNEEFNPTDSPLTYISFKQPVVGFDGVSSMTRSTLMTTEDLEEFSVCGFCVPQSLIDASKLEYGSAGAEWASKAKFCRPNVFSSKDGTNAAITVKKSASIWEYDNVKKWSDPFDDANKQLAPSAKFTFIAWANGNYSLDTYSADVAPKLHFSMPFSGGTQAKPQACNHENVSDALIAYTYDHTPARGMIPLRFEHILTGIRFRIANHSNETLTIKSMTFEGQFFGSATFTYESANLIQNVDRDKNRYWGQFKLVDGNNPYVSQKNTTGDIIGKTADNPDGLTLLLLPDPNVNLQNPDETRTALGDNKKIKISYSLTDADGIETDYDPVTIEVDLSYKPNQSTRYTATFNFLGKNQFYLVFKSDKAWEDGSDDFITIN